MCFPSSLSLLKMPLDPHMLSYLFRKNAAQKTWKWPDSSLHFPPMTKVLYFWLIICTGLFLPPLRLLESPSWSCMTRSKRWSFQIKEAVPCWGEKQQLCSWTQQGLWENHLHEAPTGRCICKWCLSAPLNPLGVLGPTFLRCLLLLPPVPFVTCLFWG